MPATLFLSYSQDDIVWLTLLRNHLAPLQRSGLLETWDDQELRAGDREGWESILLGKLREAAVILVLWSPSFAASDYCQKELEIALGRKRGGAAKVFLIQVRPSVLQASIAEFQIRPREDRAISTSPDPDSACKLIAKEIKEELEDIELVRGLGLSENWIPLYDRSPQISALDDLLDEKRALKHRPLCFMVAGADREFHEMLHERLAKRPLPQRLLGRGENPNRVLPLRLRWEIAKDGASAKRRHKQSIEDALTTECDLLPKGLSYLRVRLRVASNLDRVQKAVLTALLDFLNCDMPDIPAGKALCIGVSIEWEQSGPSRNVLKKQFVEDSYSNLVFRVLPDLESPAKDDAPDWVDEVGLLKPGGFSPVAELALREEVARLFGEAKTMPMRDLNQKFSSMFRLGL